MQLLTQMKHGWSTFFLALAMVALSAYAIEQAELTPGLQILLLIGFVGYIAGFLLALSNFSRRAVILFSSVYGLFFIGYVIGSTFLPADMLWSERVADMFSRQAEWVNKVFNGGTSRDALIFTMHTSVVFWILGHTAAWYTFRNLKIWRVVLPSGIVLLSVVYYYYGPRPLWLYLITYVVISFLYISRTYLSEQQSQWASSTVRYERSITYNFLVGAFLLSAIALMGAWAVPAAPASAAVNQAISGVNTPWRRMQDNWTRLFSSLRSYGTTTSDTYSDNLSLGGARNVGDTLIMDVFVSEEIPYAYWQATVYETYEDGRWDSPNGERRIHIPDDGNLFVPLTDSRSVITQTVRNYLPNSGMLYGLPEVVGSDRQMYITERYDTSGGSLVSLVQSRYVLQQGDVYETRSRLSRANQTELREASADYPDWINPYLQVPDTITQRTLDLADELMAPHDNNFDKAIAVRNYLRTTIEYNDQIDAPPDGVEPIDYVLFDLQEGYCNYYATSMAIMLRSQGIPARMAAGFASGEYIEDAQVYRVRAKDAHTWVEVYFPEYGWIQFEPTASIPTVSRPQGGDSFDNLDGLDGSGLDNEDPDRGGLLGEDEFFDEGENLGDINLDLEPVNEEFSWRSLITLRNLRIVAAIVVVILSGVALFLANIINRRTEGDIIQSYDRLGRWSRLIGQEPHSYHTPFERAEVMVQAVPDGRRPIRSLTQQFVREKFSREQQVEEGFDPLDEWRELRPALIRRAAAHQFERLRQRISSLRQRIRFWY